MFIPQFIYHTRNKPLWGFIFANVDEKKTYFHKNVIKLKRKWKDSGTFHFSVYLRYSEVNR